MSYSVKETIFLNCSPDTLFKFLTLQEKLMLWFAPQVIAVPVEGTVIAFAFEFDLNFKMQITKLEENKFVEWECVDGYQEWLGSKVKFEIVPDENGAILNFLHSGLNNDDKKEKTNESWREYLRKLKGECESCCRG